MGVDIWVVATLALLCIAVWNMGKAIQSLIESVTDLVVLLMVHLEWLREIHGECLTCGLQAGKCKCGSDRDNEIPLDMLRGKGSND